MTRKIKTDVTTRVNKKLAISGGGYLEVELNAKGGHIRLSLSDDEGGAFLIAAPLRYAYRNGTDAQNLKLLHDLRDVCDTMIKDIENA